MTSDSTLFLTIFSISFGVGLSNDLFNQVQLTSDFDARIWNGRNAEAGQFPYQALLQMTTGEGNMASCGGSLITPSLVLTAAHCCQGFNYTTVYLGLINKTEKDEAYVQKFNVLNSSFIIHEDYDPSYITNDICILKLPTQALINNNVSTVSLPVTNDETPSQYDSRSATISGWGQVKDGGTVHPMLQWSTVSIKPHWLCRFIYSFINPVDNYEICSSKIPYTGPCRGDSGGPLTVYDADSEKQVEIGLVSWGAGQCSSIIFPIVFTYVPYYLDWIVSHMNDSSS